MRSLPARYEPAQVQAESAAFWKARSLPTSGGRGTGPRLHQMVAALAAYDSAISFLQRAVRADAESRFLGLEGHPTRGRLLARRTDHPALEVLRPMLAASGVWVGNGRLEPLAEVASPPQIQEMVDHLARDGLLASRELPLRSCPACRAPRSPEGIVYSAEDGDAYLVRFLLDGKSPRTSLLVWIDSAWKLLGTSAVLVHPDLTYARIRYRRRGTEEVLLVLSSAIGRLKSWLEGCEIEVLEEQKGETLVGLRYEHPLATEFPTLASLPVPAGQIAASTEVDDSGTGAVALVPAHGAGDAAAAFHLGIPGWPVVDAEGQLVRDLQHKYAGLPVDVAEAFVLRDLTESGLLFAQLRVHRGVPHCIVCGTALYWQPSRAWCLDASTAPPAVRDRLARLAPAESFPKTEDPVAWPVSEWRTTEAADAPHLLECVHCGRLSPIADAPERCTCGAHWRTVARRLLPSLQEALAIWATDRPFPDADAVRLYVPERRRAPALVHHAVALAAAGAAPGEVRVVPMPTLPFEAEGETTSLDAPADALRAALLRTATSPRANDPGLGDRRHQEERRLRKIWQVAREILDRFLRDGYEPDPRSIGGHVAELPEEDRAFLSLFERMRIDVIRAYETGAVDVAQDRLVRFFEEELRAGYLAFSRSRLDLPGFPLPKAAACRVLGHVLPLWAELYAPIAPFTMEAIHRGFRGDGTSIFERPLTPSQELLLDSPLELSYARWRSVVDTLREYRSELGLAPDSHLPAIVLSVTDETVAGELRSHRAVLQRLAGVERVDVASPSQPWEGKQVRIHAVPEEIQRAYPFQAPRILRMLEGMSPTRIQDGIRARSLELVLEGHPLPITPSMVEITEALATGVVPIPWAHGDLFVTLPSDMPGRGDAAPPALTPDGFRLLHLLRRRLNRAATPSAIDRVVFSASGTLGEELTRHAAAISQFLQGVEIVVAADAASFVSAETTHGRTRRGERWSLWIPGVPVGVSSRRKPPRPRRPRRRATGRPIGDDVVIDFLDEGLRAREAAIREAVESFDHALGRPLIGPAKLARAWESGLTSFDAVAHAPYEQLAEVEGFGPVLAATIVQGFGGTPPPRIRPMRPREPPEVSVPPISPATPPPPVAVMELTRPAPPLILERVPSEPPPRSLPTVAAVATIEVASALLPSSIPDPILAVAPRIELPTPPSPPEPEPEPEAPSPPPEPAAPVPVPAPEAPAAPPPPPSGVEVWTEPTADRPWATFLELTDAGVAGLCLSREFPERLRAALGSRNVRVVWLSNVGREGSVRPGDLETLRALFRTFLGGGPGRTAYIEGVEYLVRIHGSARTIDFLHELDALASESGGRLILPVNPALMDPSASDRLTAEFRAGV